MIFIGIDPGKDGAIAEISPRPAVDVYPFDFDQWGGIVGGWEMGYFCLIERGHSMPKQGSTSGFKFGVSCGRAQGWCEALGIPWDFVSAAAWQRVMLSGEKRKTRPERKAASIRVAQRLFPKVDLTLGRGTKPKDGAADALLIAEYARRIYGKAGG